MFFHSYVLNEFPSKNKICDHINRNKLDNRRQNLRLVTINENNINQKKYKNNKSGHTGVYYHSSINKWVAYLGYQKQNINCGTFDSFEEAVDAREKAELKYYGFLKEQGISNQYAERL